MFGEKHQRFGFWNVTLEICFRYPNGDVKKAVGYVSLEFGEEVQPGEMTLESFRSAGGVWILVVFRILRLVHRMLHMGMTALPDPPYPGSWVGLCLVLTFEC